MTQNSTAEKQKTISIKRTVNLPLSTVWKAWTEPESFKKWWVQKNLLVQTVPLTLELEVKC